MIFTYIAVFYITLSCVRTRKEQRTLVYVIISTALLLSVIGLFKRFGMNPFACWIYPDVGIEHTSSSVKGTYVNRNHMAGFLEMTIPILLMLFFTRQRTVEIKTGLISLTLFLLITQALTLSRGGWISTISAILFFAIVLLKKKKVHRMMIVTIGMSVMIIFLFILSNKSVVERITTLIQQDLIVNETQRIKCWEGVIHQIKDNLFFGTGPNTFTVVYPFYQRPGNTILERYAHNDYLHFISEIGIVFIPIMIFILFIFFKLGFQQLKSRSRQKMGVSLGSMAGIFAILIHSFSDFNLNIPANALVFTIIAGLITQNDKIWIKKIL